MIVMIDNYDSFTWNLVQLFESVGGVKLEVIRNDEFEVDQLLASKPAAIIVSPGPGIPARAGAIVDLIAGNESIPLLGVCLGHQAIGEAFGGRTIRGPVPVHGKVSEITHNGERLFSDCPNPLPIARYHSLMIERSTLPESLLVDAETSDGVIMAVSHTSRPLWGVQFHPESYGSSGGDLLARNFLRMAGVS
jgi:anthranilate synthase component II